MRAVFFACCLLVLGALAPRDVAAVQIVNARGVFTLRGLSLPDLTPPWHVDMRLDPGQVETVSLPPGKSRLKADMGMVRFVFPAGAFGAVRKLVVEGSEFPVLVVTDARGALHRMRGTLVNPSAGDAGDEAVFDARQFLPPADLEDVALVLGHNPKARATGWEGTVSYGPLRGKGRLRVQDGQVRLTISGELTSATIPAVLLALETQGRLWRVAVPDLDTVWDGDACPEAQRPTALRQLASDLTAGLQHKRGLALLASMDRAASGDAALGVHPILWRVFDLNSQEARACILS